MWQYTALTYCFPNLEPVSCPMSGSNCCFLSCIQVSQEAGQVVWYSHLLNNFPQFVVIHTFKGFSIVNKAQVDVFLELSYFFYDPVMSTIWSLVPLPFLNPVWTFGSSRFTYSWNLAWRILSLTFATLWDECNYVVVWTIFGIALPWDWNENWPFLVLWPLLSLPNLLTYWGKHFNSKIQKDICTLMFITAFLQWPRYGNILTVH